MTDDEDDGPLRVPWGDMGALILAAGTSIFTLWLIGDMLLGGHPLAALFPPPKPAASPGPTEEELRNAPMQLAPGEVRIAIPPKPKKPPPKS